MSGPARHSLLSARSVSEDGEEGVPTVQASKEPRGGLSVLSNLVVDGRG